VRGIVDDQAGASGLRAVSPVIKWLAVAELVVGVGALALMGETNPLYYLLIVGVAVVVVAAVASDQRRRERSDAAVARRAAEAASGSSAMPEMPAAPPAADPAATSGATPPARPAVERPGAVAGTTGAPGPSSIVPLRSASEEFVASLIEYGTRVGVRTITRADRAGWAGAQSAEYQLLRAASCCGENEQGIVGELVTWDSVSVLHQLDTGSLEGSGIARSVVAPYGRLPAATRVPVRRDPARVTCEVATLALDPRVANEFALHLLWRGIYDHARRGGATDVVWTLAIDLAMLWREHYGFPVTFLGDGKRAPSGTAVTIAIALADLEQRMLRDRPAYLGWMTVAFSDAERSALGLAIDLSGAYERVCAHVMAKLDSVRSPLVLQ
jgi:hypothetical protein